MKGREGAILYGMIVGGLFYKVTFEQGPKGNEEGHVDSERGFSRQ